MESAKQGHVRKMRTVEQLLAEVAIWNRHVEDGDWIVYKKDDGTSERRRTRSRAQLLSDHTAVVWLEGKCGCIPLSRCSLPSKDKPPPGILP